MKYSEYLKTLIKCPFCHNIRHRILFENEKALLTLAQAPYHKYHLLVIPKQHSEKIKDLSWDENVCIMALIVTGIKALDKLGHNDCTILVRDSKALAKSVKHLHYHIIPGGKIEDVTLNLQVRKLITEEEEKFLKEELKETINL